MRIVRRAEFIELPEGTVYAEISPWVVGNLRVKAENLPNDWWFLSFDWVEADDSIQSIERLEEMRSNSSVSYPVEGSITRDGMFEDEQLFLVYGASDIKHIIEELSDALAKPQEL